MQIKSKLILCLTAALAAMGFEASAQTSSINAYSPYSMYGPGELSTPCNVAMRSTGDVGLRLRNTGQINTLNPAALSVAPSKSFLMDFGVDGTHFRNNQQKYTADGAAAYKAKTAYNTVNFHNLSIAFPIARGLGGAVSVAPYSSVGYKVKNTEDNKDIWADVGRVMYGYDGDGDITEVKLSIGWEVARNFSIGVAAKYYWGNIERNYSATAVNIITGSGEVASTVGVDKYQVSNFKFQAGVQWNAILDNKRILTFGATYDLGGKLNPDKTSYVYTNNIFNQLHPFPVRDRIDAVELRLPHQAGIGVYYQDRTIAWGVDYVYANWGGDNGSFAENATKGIRVAYSDTHTIKAGFAITPRMLDARNYLNRMTYRIGARVGNYYQTFAGQRIDCFAVTAGLGFPVRLWGSSSINLGFEFGCMRAPDSVAIDARRIGLVNQKYYKLSLGFNLFSADTSDYWFVRQKYD